MKKPIKIKLSESQLDEMLNKVGHCLIDDSWEMDEILHVKAVSRRCLIDAVIDAMVEVEEDKYQ